MEADVAVDLAEIVSVAISSTYALAGATMQKGAVDESLFFEIDARETQARREGNAAWRGGHPSLPLREALGAFGVLLGGLDPSLDGEPATAYHNPSSKASTLLWGVADSAAVHALLEKDWTVKQKTALAREGPAKRLGGDSFGLAPAPPGTTPVRERLVGDR